MLAFEVLRGVIADIQGARLFTVIVDETADVTQHEQMSVCIRYFDNDLNSTEDFIGFYQIESTSANTLFSVLNDSLLRLGLSWSDCRGQCYDGVANMSGSRSGLQVRVKDIQEEAMYVHCNAHNMNLAFQDAVSRVNICRDAMKTVKELINSIRVT
ncbi:Zinc finger MYM-type protein 1 [Merluccius polli]|uniref:Zinc finger MYM-type protein 1 n=1 Tax=Merluccius polli TaxID=89951 RepID=A0AA47MX69_MERPO|nr:Zinc finger MYM-type protein 1 [Merluccius polli]